MANATIGILFAMWLDEQGVMHTCAFAEPSSAMNDELVADVLRLVDLDSDGLADELDRLEDELLESMSIGYDRRVEQAFCEQWLPGASWPGEHRRSASCASSFPRSTSDGGSTRFSSYGISQIPDMWTCVTP